MVFLIACVISGQFARKSLLIDSMVVICDNIKNPIGEHGLNIQLYVYRKTNIKILPNRFKDYRLS